MDTLDDLVATLERYARRQDLPFLRLVSCEVSPGVQTVYSTSGISITLIILAMVRNTEAVDVAANTAQTSRGARV